MIFQIQNNILIEILLILFLFLPLLLGVAYLTVFERKALARMQRRVGPETVGPEGVLQAFADALKVSLKEQIIPSHSNKIIFYIAPVSTLIFSLLNWIVVPLYPGLAVLDFSLTILVILALSSLGVYGILFVGWSSNSKYAFLGSLRSVASMISYELILSTGVLIIILSVGSFNLERIIEAQSSSWNIFSNIIIFLMIAISLLAETGRTPFDLPEAESEIVAGHLTETSATIFLFLYLAEYNAILFYSCFMAMLFLGGSDYNLFESVLNIFSISNLNISSNFFLYSLFSLPVIASGLWLGAKTAMLSLFIFILSRGTLPRTLFSTLIEFSWAQLLPAIMACFVLYISLYSALDIVPTGLAMSSLLIKVHSSNSSNILINNTSRNLKFHTSKKT